MYNFILFLSKMLMVNVNNYIGITLGLLSLVFSFSYELNNTKSNLTSYTSNVKAQRNHLKKLYLVLLLSLMTIVTESCAQFVQLNTNIVFNIKMVVYTVINIYIVITLLNTIYYIGIEMFRRKK